MFEETTSLSGRRLSSREVEEFEPKVPLSIPALETFRDAVLDPCLSRNVEYEEKLIDTGQIPALPGNRTAHVNFVGLLISRRDDPSWKPGGEVT